MKARGFTLIELTLVLLIAGLLFFVVGFRFNALAFVEEAAFVRRLTETIQFLHTQAALDGAYYQLRCNLDQGTYQVGVLRTAGINQSLGKEALNGVGALSLELLDYLEPSLSGEQTLIAPPSFPSLGEVQHLPKGSIFEDIRGMRGKKTKEQGGEVSLLFSPREFSEFGVIHLKHADGRQLTILINPFTGGVTVYHEYKDFEWTYGKSQRQKRT